MAPWLSGFVSRAEAEALAIRPDYGVPVRIPQKADGVFRRLLDVDGTEGLASAESCAECPDATCLVGSLLPEMAVAWYAEGGLPRDIVVLLYNLIGAAWCSSLICERSAPLENCKFECVDIYQAWVHDGPHYRIAWVYMIYCCCMTVEEGPIGPTTDIFIPDRENENSRG